MKTPIRFTLCLLLLTAVGHGAPAERKSPRPDGIITYKTVKRSKGEFDLKLHVFNPPNHRKTGQRPCIVMFHSGGWNGGDPSKFYGACKRYASKGMVAISAEYSIRDVHGGTPFDSVTDGKSAIRWVRAHANELGVNPDMIAASGSSAGGHVAAATAHLTSFEEDKEDLKTSSKPNALVLISPVMDNGPGGYGHDRVKKRWKEFSPAHNVAKGAPPASVFMGDAESRYLRVEIARKYKQDMEAVGSRCELMVFPGQEHGGYKPDYRKTVDEETDRFLKSLGYLK